MAVYRFQATARAVDSQSGRQTHRTGQPPVALPPSGSCRRCTAGQTLSGDHGGGSPEEVDTALVAIDPAALRPALLEGSGSHASSSPGSTPLPAGSLTAGSGGLGAGGQQSGDMPGRPAASAGGREQGRGRQAPHSLWAPDPCRHNCSCGPDRNQCAVDLPQIDLAPTLATLLGVPIPFGSLGKVAPELWGFAAAAPQQEQQRGGRDAELAAALRANAEQVSGFAGYWGCGGHRCT